MINYLFSQVKKDTGFSEIQKEFLLKNIKNDMSITYISSIPDNHERTDDQVSRFNNCFSNIGITFSNTYYIDSRISKEDAKDYINNSDIVFLLGGSPDLQMKFINEYELNEVIANANIVIGVSAGSMNQGERVVYKDDFENFVMKDYKGLGLTDSNIFPHYDENNIDCVNEVKEVKEINEILCLPNESFIYVENGKTKILGKYYK